MNLKNITNPGWVPHLKWLVWMLSGVPYIGVIEIPSICKSHKVHENNEVMYVSNLVGMK